MRQMKVIVTNGPILEHIDPYGRLTGWVPFVSEHSNEKTTLEWLN
jgi:hypothetical protein